LGDIGPENPLSEQRNPKTEQFLELLGAHERGLFAYVYALTYSWQDAEEVMQRVRIRIWQQFEQYDIEKPFGAWARAIAYYLVLAYRKEKSRHREFFTEHIMDAIGTEFENHLQNANHRRDALLACLDKLDDRKRDLVITRYSLARQTVDEIATHLSMTPNALRQALFRIRKALLECVERTIQMESHQ
jgi:RNA polymerase sigma-70 factor, ECF subfamily